MSEDSRSRVTITLGRSGQVVKRAGSSLGSSFTEDQVIGSKRPVRERLGSNNNSFAQVSNKRVRRDGMPGNAFDDIHLSKGDLRYKIMQKNVLKHSQNGKQNSGDLRNISSRPAQSSTNSVATRDRMPEPKNARQRYLDQTNGRQHFTETTDGRSVAPVTGSASLHIPEFGVGHTTGPRKQHILEVGGGERSIYEAQNARRPMPETRALSAATRMDSGINLSSPLTLDRLRRRSPDESLATSRVVTAPKKDEILQRRYPIAAYEDVRTSSYLSKDPYDISRPMSSSLPTKTAPPVGPLRTTAPVASSLSLSGSLMQKSSYVFVSHSRSLAAARRLVDSPRRRRIPLQPLFPPSAVNLRNNMESDSTSPINLEGDDVDVSMKDTLIPGQSECHEDGVKKEELRKKRRLSSGVWSHFRILPAKPNEQLYCECIKCKKKYLADSKMGTGIAEMSLEEITQDIMALNFNKDAVESIGEASSSKI